MNDWIQAQINYEDISHDEEIAQMAVSYTEMQVNRYDGATADIVDKWETIDYMLRGNTLSNLFKGSDIHVPILYTMVEALVPRVVEAITSMRPWFEVEGRDKIDKQRARKIQAYLRYEVDQTKLERRMEEIARTLITYQFVALKTRWDVRYRERINREVERTMGKDGLPSFKITPKRENEKYYEGNRFDIVAPYLFLCDVTRTDPQDMSFIGDITLMREDEIAEMANSKTYNAAAVDELIEEGKRGHATAGVFSARARMAQRSLAADIFATPTGRERHKGEPGEFEVREIWCRWRPSGADSKDEFKEWVLTTCNGKALRVQENFYDDKRRPYAVARAAKEPFDFFNVGVLDHAIRLNMEIDDHRNLARLSHRLALSPITQVGHDSDWPESLFDIEPGQVFRGKDAPNWLKVQSTIGEMIPFEQVLRMDMERATGAPEIFEGSGQNSTATEVERKVQEGNRRLRRLVFSLSDGLEDLLRHFHGNAQQFLTYQKAFRVLNEKAVGMLDLAISPDDFADPVDIVISGPERLSSYGLRATQMSTWMQQYGVLLPALQQAGAVNLPMLAKVGWERIMGEDMGSDIIAVPERSDEMLNPTDENLIMLMGSQVEVHEADDDMEHDKAHMVAQQAAEARGDSEAVKRVIEHRARHRSQSQRKAARAAAAASPQPGPFPPGGEIAPRHAPAEGRGYQPTPDLMGAAPQKTPPRETPGPARPASTGSPDRSPSAPQTANR